jgi:hypothetical protein
MSNFKKRIKAILLAWLLVGTLDILAAIANYLVNGGKNVTAIFRFIASGVFGTSAFTGGTGMVWYGLIFHYLIAFIWTFLFFLLYPQIRSVLKNKLLIGIIYGLFVWVVMNLVVVPLSNTPETPFAMVSALVQMTILILAIGLPLSLIANRHYSRADPVSQ